MRPDVSGPRQAGLLALVLSLVAAVAICWWFWSDQPAIDERLEAARKAAEKITGKEPLQRRVDLQRKANAELRENIAKLKEGTGFTAKPGFKVPEGEREPGKYFSNRFVEVRQVLRDKALNKRIECEDWLGFPPSDKVPADADAPRLLAMLQLTEKALTIVLDAPEPVAWFDISHETPYETGPVNRPVLLTEYPLRLEVRGSLKTILSILHSYSVRQDGDYPLILRGFSIRSDNTKAKDDIQQLEATFELAGMTFANDQSRGVAAAPAATSRDAGKARP